MPIGMFCWMCVEAIKMKSPEKILGQLAWFFTIAIIAFAVIWLVVYPGIYFVIIRKNPFKFMANIIPVMKRVSNTVFGVKVGCHAFKRCCLNDGSK